ncbi:FtsK/SpoIIIE domain-containing protein [Glaciihabitans sp. UYNi722]|uniref:FtsK/SpoIIIE domain-containing protein n=1 Tax=Glaciihabitans sp. UYNi722 TaxID=3156344 RepID=UPI003396F990
MRVKLTLRRESGEGVDLVVTTDATATVGNVARSILETDPAGGRAVDPSTILTLHVAPPGGAKLVHLDPDTPLGDAAIGSGFDVVVAPAPGYPSGSDATPGTAAAVLRVLSGPDSGREFRLPLGSGTIGRGAGNAVKLSDPLVSQSHARIEISADGIDVVDLNSANGILVDGGLVPRLRLPSGQSVVLGDSEVSIALLATAGDRDDGIIERGGVLRFNRSPRVESRYPGREYPVPEIPLEKDQQPFNWILMVAPVLMGGVMFAISRNPLSLGFIAMSPLMAFGNWFSQRSRVGKKAKIEIERFELQLEDLGEQLEKEIPLERSVRLLESPSVAEVYSEALRLEPRLWTRRPEHWNFLDLRLGLGRMPSRNTMTDGDAKRGLPLYAKRVDELRDRVGFIDDVPVVENPFLCGALGISGEPTAVADVARAIVVQYAGLHSPAEVAFGALLSPSVAHEFDWLKWLPHTSSPHSPIQGVQLADSASTGTALLNALEEIIEQRRTQLSRTETERGAGDEDDAASARGAKVGAQQTASFFAGGGAALVLLIANDAPVDRPRLVQIVEDAADALVFPIWMAPVAEALPAACRTFVDVARGLEAADVHFVRQGTIATDVRVEGVSAEYALMLARRLAPVVDAGAVVADSSDLPRSVPLLSLLGSDLSTEPQAAIDRWVQNKSIHDRSGRPPVARKRAGTLRALVGQSSPDAMHLDLRTQGPHALVGGTTGSGKSEFLQAWVLGMAAEYSPDRVTFLFVDYKGGAAFAECVNLPHCVGLVTDLSQHLVRRALTSLRAELHYREHLFNRKKAKDLLELEKRGDPECPPALILVIDEFAALAGEVPEFVDGVVDIAQRGRSLGIHLIMATQRPAGVIKDNLRANTNLRIALRMADESDSKDVVGDPVAGTFDPGIPGRGIAKMGPGRLVPFQSGYAGGWSSDEPREAQVSVAELRFGSTVLWESDSLLDSDSQDEDLGPNDQKRIVQTLIHAGAIAKIPAPRRPWLDDLATTADILDIEADGESRIAIGIADIPERQLQAPLFYEPDRDGAMLIYGTSGSGKSTALRSIAISAGLRPDRGGVEVYGLDFGSGGLRSIESLPHVGSIVAGDDAERLQRLLRDLRGMLDDRAKRFSEANAANLNEYREISGRPDEPRILLLIDGFGNFKQEWDASSARSPYFNIFMRILGEGRPLGVHAIATADRYGAVPTSVSANVTKRIVLRMSDEGSYGILGVPKDILGDLSAPGRGIVDGFETQIAVLGGTSNVAQQSRDVDALAERLRAAGARDVAAVGSLPTELTPQELPDSINGMPVIGMSDDVLGPRGFEPLGTFVVTGPPRSGKTNALRAVVSSMQRFDPEVKMFHFGGRRAQLRNYVKWTASATTVDDARALAKGLVELVPDESIPGKILIVVEGVTDFADSDAERPLKELFQAINRSEHFLIGDGDIAALGSGYGFIGDFKAGRRGIALKPETYDGDSLFKVPFPRVQRHEFPEGRGIFVENGQFVTVQLPLVDAEPGA